MTDWIDISTQALQTNVKHEERRAKTAAVQGRISNLMRIRSSTYRFIEKFVQNIIIDLRTQSLQSTT